MTDFNPLRLHTGALHLEDFVEGCREHLKDLQALKKKLEARRDLESNKEITDAIAQIGQEIDDTEYAIHELDEVLPTAREGRDIFNLTSSSVKKRERLMSLDHELAVEDELDGEDVGGQDEESDEELVKSLVDDELPGD